MSITKALFTYYGIILLVIFVITFVIAFWPERSTPSQKQCKAIGKRLKERAASMTEKIAANGHIRRNP